MEVVTDRDGRSAKRPGNRKAQIADAAARLFCALGYHRVSMEDIAAAVGVTGRALYRHFGNKEDLLGHVVSDGVARLEAAVDGLDGHDGAAALDSITRRLASLSSDDRELGVLLQREARHLSPSARADVQARAMAVGQRVDQTLRHTRPELSTADSTLLVRSAFGALASPSYHAVALSRTRSESLLHEMAMAVFLSRAVPWTGEVTTAPRDGDAPDRAAGEGIAPRASRREMLLSAAIGLFAQRGFSAVRMEDVGAAVGIAGPSIYQHFASKSDLLVAALTRGAEWLQFGMSRALQRGATPGEALERVVRSYVEFVLGHSDLMHLLLNETMYLPEAEQHSLRRVQHDYVAEWVRLLLEARPDLSEPEARFLTHGVLGIVNDNVQGGAERVHPQLDGILISLGLEVLVAGDRRDAAS